MDGVLVDIYPVFFELHKKETGEILTLSDIEGKLEDEAFVNQRRWVNAPGFFRNLPVMKDSREVLSRLNLKHDIIIGSLATEFPECMTDKQMWIHENLPFISWKQIVFCGDKNMIRADIMIDDHFKNLDKFDGMTILFTQPHNILVKEPRHIRVNSWPEIEKFLE